MADERYDTSRGLFGPIRRTIFYFSTVMFFLVGLQIYLNPPWKRPVTVCWPLYKAGMIFGVKSVALIAPTDTAYVIRGTRTMRNFYNGCIDSTAELPGFAHPCTEAESFCGR